LNENRSVRNGVIEVSAKGGYIMIHTPGAKPKALETKCLRRMYQGMCKKNRLNTGPRVNIIN